MNIYQSTLASTAVFVGKGLHSGRLVRLEILPASENTGIVFQRTDTVDALPVVAHAHNVSSTQLCTTLGSGVSSVATIEHLMAAFAGLEIDNALVRLDGPEVPIMDGSSAQFVEGLIRAGVRTLSAKRTYLRVKKAFEIKNGDQFIKLEPANTASYKCSIHFEKGKVIGYQTTTYKPSMEAFLDISKARTFCHINDVNAMRQRGLAMGGSLENAVVIDDAKVMNREGLRDKREFVKHKLLDLIGDFHLFGAPVMAKVTAHKAGHKLHHEAVSQLLSKSEQYLEMFVMEGDGEQTRSKVVPVQFPNLAFG